jgi:ubiquitin-like modifier-activating enzyme ATG7
VVLAETVTVLPLGQFDQLPAGAEVYLGFVDTCALPTNPGWLLRNLLTYAAYTLGMREVNVICYRDHPSLGSAAPTSRLLKVQVTAAANPVIKTVGWERNEQGNLGPRLMDLTPFMDPQRLAESSAELNLKLMRWRVLPSLSLETLNSTRALVLGAGTLGCNVARTLLGWGVKHITMVDNGRVSYSNPVRQSLYNFEDCVGGGKPKAEAAAAALRNIFPGCVAQSHHLTIPMPGHVLQDSQVLETVEAVWKLTALVEEHDLVFLLTDRLDEGPNPGPAVHCDASGARLHCCRYGCGAGRERAASPSPPVGARAAAGRAG